MVLAELLVGVTAVTDRYTVTVDWVAQGPKVEEALVGLQRHT